MNNFAFGDGNPMVWEGAWEPRLYPKDSVVTDSLWTMIANKDTTERPSPQPYGDPFHVYTGTLVPTPVSAKQVLFGTRYSLPSTGYILSYRVDVVAGNHYVIFLVRDPLGTPIVEQLNDFVAASTGILELSIQALLVTEGTTFDVMAVVNAPDPTPTVLGPWDWDYTRPNNDGAPPAGIVIHSNRELALFNINKIDDTATDRGADLATLTVGDIIDGANQRWAIQSIADNGTYFTFGVSPAAQGTPKGVQPFQFETVTVTPITYGLDTDHWLGNADVRGMFIVDGDYSDITPDDNAYGIDIEVQGATVSDDWDVLAYPPSGVSGGGAGTFPQRYTSDPIPAPIVVTEGGAPTTLVNLTVDAPIVGLYQVNLLLIANFGAANDFLTWRSIGSTPTTNDFEINAGANGVRQSYFIQFDFVSDGTPFNTTVEAEVTGPGQADVTISTANAVMARVG